MAKLSTYTAATTVAPTDTLPIIQGGSNKVATARQVRGDAITALSIAAGAVNIDLALGNNFTLSLTANVTSITFSNLPASGYVGEFELQFTQDGTGSRTVSLPASFKALGDSDIAVASAASAVTVLSAKTFDQGTTWRYAMQGSA